VQHRVGAEHEQRVLESNELQQAHSATDRHDLSAVTEVVGEINRANLGRIKEWGRTDRRRARIGSGGSRLRSTVREGAGENARI
jgi:hypothetical protein